MKKISLLFITTLCLIMAVACSSVQNDRDKSLGVATVFQYDKTVYVVTDETVPSEMIGKELGEVKRELINVINCPECKAASDLIGGEEIFQIQGIEPKQAIAVKRKDGYFKLKNKELVLQEIQK